MNRRIFIGAVGTIGAALGAGAALPREAQQAPLNPQAGGSGASGDRIERLVKSAPFFNASDNTTFSRLSGLQPGPLFNAEYIARLKRGGVTVVSASTVFHLYDDFYESGFRIFDFYKLMEQYRDDLRPVLRYEDIELARREGKIAILMHAHTPSIMDGDARRLDLLHRLGLRVMGFSHIQSSVLAEGGGEDLAEGDGGLTRLGKYIVSDMNRLHMVIDLAHVSDKSRLQACAISRDPVLVSHTACRAVAAHADPALSNRMISDEGIRAVQKNGGVVGIFALTHILLADGDYQRADSIAPYVDHIEHVIKVAGIDFVGVGTETQNGFVVRAGEKVGEDVAPLFEDMLDRLGPNTPAIDASSIKALADNKVPKGTNRVIGGMRDMGSAKRNLIVELIARGHSDEDIQKILGGNMLRVHRRVLEGA
ncbi:MAG: dipeptidase [Steroidobacteraceae bacterium]